MIALDTNVVVRFLVNDDRVQGARAHALIEREALFLAPTVLLECEWVLRHAYGFAPADIRRFLRALLGLPQMTVEDPARIAAALDDYEAGFDFADALHCAFSDRAEVFASFDEALVQAAARRGGLPVIAV